MWVPANALSEAAPPGSSAAVPCLCINSAPAVKTTNTKLLPRPCAGVCCPAAVLSCKGHLSVRVAVAIGRFYFLVVSPESPIEF